MEKKTAIQTMLDWAYNPSDIENKVDSREFTEEEKQLIEKFKEEK